MYQYWEGRVGRNAGSSREEGSLQHRQDVRDLGPHSPGRNLCRFIASNSTPTAASPGRGATGGSGVEPGALRVGPRVASGTCVRKHQELVSRGGDWDCGIVVERRRERMHGMKGATWVSRVWEGLGTAKPHTTTHQLLGRLASVHVLALFVAGMCHGGYFLASPL